MEISKFAAKSAKGGDGSPILAQYVMGQEKKKGMNIVMSVLNVKVMEQSQSTNHVGLFQEMEPNGLKKLQSV